MKKLSYAILLCAMLSFLCVQARAAPTEIKTDDAEKYKNQLISMLPPLAYDKIGDKISADNVSELACADYLAELVFETVWGEGGDAIKRFCTLLAFVVFSALLSFFRESLGDGACDVAESMLLVISSLAVVNMFSFSVEMALSYIYEASEFTSALIPLTAGLYLMGGNTATAVSASAGAGAALLCIESLCSVTLPLLVRVSLSLTLVGSISTNASYGMICKNVRNTYIGVLGFCSMILFCSLTFGNLISSAQDSVAARAVKYAIGNMLPVVGSTVTSAYGTISASVTMIKTTLGVSAIVALCIISLPVIVNLIFVRLSLNLCADIAQMLNCAKIGKLYSDFRAVYDLALAAVVFVAIIFVIIISVFLKCCTALS